MTDRKVIASGTFMPEEVETARAAAMVTARFPNATMAAVAVLTDALGPAADDPTVADLLAELTEGARTAHAAGERVHTILNRLTLAEGRGAVQ